MDVGREGNQVRELGGVGNPVPAPGVATTDGESLPAVVDEHRAAAELHREGGLGGDPVLVQVLGEGVPGGVDRTAGHRRHRQRDGGEPSGEPVRESGDRRRQGLLPGRAGQEPEPSLDGSRLPVQLDGEGLVLLGDPVADLELIDQLVQRPGEQTASRGVVQAADRRPADQAGRRLAGPVGLQGALGTSVGMPVADAQPERHLEAEVEADAGREPELQLGPGAVGRRRPRPRCRQRWSAARIPYVRRRSMTTVKRLPASVGQTPSRPVPRASGSRCSVVEPARAADHREVAAGHRTPRNGGVDGSPALLLALPARRRGLRGCRPRRGSAPLGRRRARLRSWRVPTERGDHQGGHRVQSGGVEPAVAAVHDPGRLAALVEADRRVGPVGPLGGSGFQGGRDPGRRDVEGDRLTPDGDGHLIADGRLDQRRTLAGSRPQGRGEPPRGRRWAPTSQGVEPRVRSVVARILPQIVDQRAAGRTTARHHPSSLHHGGCRA